MGKSWMSPMRKLPTKGSDRQEGSAAGLGQKRPGVNNASSTKKKKQSFIDNDSANDLSTGWSGVLSLNSDSDEDNDSNQKGRLTTNLTEKSRTELVKIVKEQRKQIKYLQIKLATAKTAQKQTKKQVQIEQDWTGEETNSANGITTFCKMFLFPRYKFLKEGWHEYDPNRSDSLLSLVKRKVAIPERANSKHLWERVVVPTIQLKNINMKSNLNNEIKKAYMSEYRNW
jgi:hypothetical protein